MFPTFLYLIIDQRSFLFFIPCPTKLGLRGIGIASDFLPSSPPSVCLRFVSRADFYDCGNECVMGSKWETTLNMLIL